MCCRDASEHSLEQLRSFGLETNRSVGLELLFEHKSFHPSIRHTLPALQLVPLLQAKEIFAGEELLFSLTDVKLLGSQIALQGTLMDLAQWSRPLLVQISILAIDIS